MATLHDRFRLISSLASVWDTHRHLAPTYLESVQRATGLADRFGYAGVLLHYNLHALEPWPLVAVILQNTIKLVPLIAAQPALAPPHTIARLCMTAACLFKRRVDLNLIIGAKAEEHQALADELSHDQRYERLTEYGAVVRGIIDSDFRFTHHGLHYRYENFELTPKLPRDLTPQFFVAGSSAVAVAMARQLADVIVVHPQAVSAFDQDIAEAVRASTRSLALGIRVGIIARPGRTAAWKEAHERFPQSRRGETMVRMKTQAESKWIRDLAQDSLSEDASGSENVFWLGAYRSGKAYCPYLVGSYEEVAEALAAYHRVGARTLLVDGPDNEIEFAHTDQVMRLNA